MSILDYTFRMQNSSGTQIERQSETHRQPWKDKRRAALNFLLLTTVFSIAYAQSPLYTSNQNQYFLHGLAQAGYGYLNQDWLANTPDPTPVFSALVTLTYRITHLPVLFYLFYALLMGIYIFSLLGIVTSLYPLRSSRAKFLSFLALLILVHSAAWRFAISRSLGVNWTYILEDGVADQRLLGPVFEPSTFAVLLILSIYLFMHHKPYLAAISAALAATVHPTYLLSAAGLTLAYMLVTAIESQTLEKRQVTASLANQLTPRFQNQIQGAPATPPKKKNKAWLKPFLIGGLALLVVLPILVYVFVNFGDTPRETSARAQDILVNYRIPHHALINWWWDATAVVKILLVAAALYLTRKNRLFFILLVLSLVAAGLTILQVLLKSNMLALIFPWRISIILVPLATAILLAELVSAAFRYLGLLRQRRFQNILTISSLLLISAVVLVGAIRFVLDLQRSASATERPLEAYVAVHHTSGQVYLTPTKMQDFRLRTGSPVYIEFKSIPYQDANVLEWYHRIQLADQFYKKGDCTLLNEMASQGGVTHLVLENGAPGQACSHIRPIYKDANYSLFALETP